MGSTTMAACKAVSSLTLIGPFKIWARAQMQQPLALTLKFKPVLWVVPHVTKTSLVVKKREGMRDRKLVGSRQRSLSSRFILPRRERPLQAGNLKYSTSIHPCPFYMGVLPRHVAILYYGAPRSEREVQVLQNQKSLVLRCKRAVICLLSWYNYFIQHVRI